jgi:hypothetical protein
LTSDRLIIKSNIAELNNFALGLQEDSLAPDRENF